MAAMRCVSLWLLLFVPLAASAELEVAAPRPGDEGAVSAWVDAHLEELSALYRHLHAHPELSLEEEQTAARVAVELEPAGYSVTRGVGGHGVVAVLENGAGPTVLLRGDMDALPVTEATGLSYASSVRATRADGSETGVMHACGHDVHTANLVGTARLLADLRERWRGTIVVVAQPAEELGLGARSMLGEGLLERFPRPDFALALHVSNELPAGSVGYTEGWAAANVDSVDVRLHGRGGHGARPHQAVDPVVVAAHLVTALQTLVSRRVDPMNPAVVTVGSIHGGTKHNVIPDFVDLQLTVRSYSDEVRAQLLDGIRQLAADVCQTFRCPEAPTIRVKETYTPAVYNDPALARGAADLFAALFGDEAVARVPAGMGGEDFGMLPRAAEVPGLLYRLGSVDPALVAAAAAGGEALPSLHSSRFAPLPEPTLRVGVRSLGHLALGLLDAP
jgi:amidohydrolase